VLKSKDPSVGRPSKQEWADGSGSIGCSGQDFTPAAGFDQPRSRKEKQAMQVLNTWKKAIFSSMCRCCDERVWCRSYLRVSCGTSTKITTLETMITGVDQRVVRSPIEWSMTEALVAVMKAVETQETRKRESVVFAIWMPPCRFVYLRFSQMMSDGSGARFTSILAAVEETDA
jgi:hypothetical protein